MGYVGPPAQGGAAQRDGILVEVLGQGRQGQVLDTGAACTHPENGHLLRIAAKRTDVVVDPLQGLYLERKYTYRTTFINQIW